MIDIDRIAKRGVAHGTTCDWIEMTHAERDALVNLARAGLDANICDEPTCSMCIALIAARAPFEATT